MIAKDDIGLGYLSQCLKYLPGPGSIYWQHRPFHHFGSAQAWKRWNTMYAHSVAGTNKDGYLRIGIGNSLYYGHRLAWALHHGEYPEGEIDHINRNRLDNRIMNLREVSHAQNMQNKGERIDNTSGVIGVTWDKASNKWQAGIGVNGKYKNLGRFDCIEHAAIARESAERELGYCLNAPKT